MNSKKEVNLRLKLKYGIDTVSGEQLWRVVFADEEFEVRSGVFSDYDGPVFIREVKEIRKVPKYPSPEHKHMWILEKLVPIPPMMQDELGVKMNYEPAWVLSTFDNKRLPLSFKAIDNFIWFSLYGHRLHLTEKDFEDKEKRESAKRIAEYYDMLDGTGTSFLGMQLAHGEAVFGAGLKAPTFGEKKEETSGKGEGSLPEDNSSEHGAGRHSSSTPGNEST